MPLPVDTFGVTFTPSPAQDQALLSACQSQTWALDTRPAKCAHVAKDQPTCDVLDIFHVHDADIYAGMSGKMASCSAQRQAGLLEEDARLRVHESCLAL